MPRAFDLDGVSFRHRCDDYENRIADAIEWFEYRSGEDLSGHTAWATIPFQHRADLSRSFSRGDPGPLRRWLQTSGTSGRPMLAPFSLQDEEQACDTVDRVHRLLPDLSGRTAVVGIPSDTSAAGFHAARQLSQVGVAVVHTGVLNPSQLIHDIEYTNATIVITLPRVACRLAELSQRLFGRLPSVDYVMVAGDVAAPARLRRIEKTWHAKALDGFGLTEIFGPSAVQIEPGVLQWAVNQTLVEVINPVTLQSCAEGETGVLVISTMWHKAMPLLRYWTSDVVRVLAPGPEGEFRFAAVGRPLSRVPVGDCGIYLSAIDQTVVSAEWTGTEWDLSSEGTDSFLLTVEAAEPDSTAERLLLSDLRALGDWVPQLEVVPLGSLPRSHAKFQMA